MDGNMMAVPVTLVGECECLFFVNNVTAILLSAGAPATGRPIAKLASHSTQQPTRLPACTRQAEIRAHACCTCH